MHLLLDVGNTETVLGVAAPGMLELEGHWRYATSVPRTADELRLLLSGLLRESGYETARITRVVIASVVPAQTDLLRRALELGGRPDLFHLEGDDQLPIRLDVEEPRTVGADRIANTLAAARIYAKDTVVVDLGTATSYDCITGDGVFVGGVISPGLQAGEEWLARRTAKLPRVRWVPPGRVIGRRTESCLQSGIFYSAVDAVDGIVSRIREEWERPHAHIVATGGFASLLAPHSRTIQEVDPFLTLKGLQLAGEYMAGDTDPSLPS